MTMTDFEKVGAIISDAGGKIVGRTKLQKIAYLLNVAGFEDEFDFVYKHYGPYSEELAHATSVGVLLDTFKEEERIATWGGSYSIFYRSMVETDSPENKKEFVRLSSKADAVALELAATAVFLFLNENKKDPWEEVKERKPEKAELKNIENAINLLNKLRNISVPDELPKF